MPAPHQEAAEPGNALGSRSPRLDREGAVEALAYFLDNLYGCIKLINEGRPASIQARANIRKAAVLLKIKYTTLYAKIRKHRLHFSKSMRFHTDGSDIDI